MATIVEKKFVDDLDGSEAAETVPFSIDGMDFEIDLSAANADRLRALLAEFALAARPRAKRTTKKGKASTSGYDVPKVRAWWFENWEAEGLPEASDRARIPNVVRDAAIAAGVIPPILSLAA